MGLFDGWDTGNNLTGGQGIFPPWLTQILQTTPPEVLMQGLQALKGGFPQQPQETGSAALPPNAQPASLSPQAMMGGYEPRKSIFDRPDSIPGDRMDGAPPPMGMQPGGPQTIGSAPEHERSPGGFAPQGGRSTGIPVPAGVGEQSKSNGGSSNIAAMASSSSGGGYTTSPGFASTGLMGLIAPRMAARMDAAQTVNLTEQALIRVGVPREMAPAMARNPQLLSAIAPQLFKQQARPLSAQEKQQYGLPAHLPWMLGPDGKPSLPEGLAQAKPEIKGDAHTGYVGVDPWNMKATPITGAGKPTPKIDDVTQIRKEVSALPEVKRYSEALPIFRSMVASHGKDSAAADLDYVYGVAKIFDPESVVREGEMKLVGQAQSIPEDVKGFIKRAAYGEGRLDANARLRILEVARTRMGELNGSYTERLKPYSGIAERFGMRREDILPQVQDLPDLPPAAPPPNFNSLPANEQMRLAPDGSRAIIHNRPFIKRNGNWVPVQ